MYYMAGADERAAVERLQNIADRLGFRKSANEPPLHVMIGECLMRLGSHDVRAVAPLSRVNPAMP